MALNIPSIPTPSSSLLTMQKGNCDGDEKSSGGSDIRIAHHRGDYSSEKDNGEPEPRSNSHDAAILVDGGSRTESNTLLPSLPQPHLRLPPQPPTATAITTAPQTNNVGELVIKAKKAATSLWMLLHAQNCRQANNNCPHRGCTETKPLLLHIKTCIAGPNISCPMQYKGCNEARKLLAHYRKCKDVRSRRHQNHHPTVRRSSTSSTSANDQGATCLVCSLMARHAMSMMERTATIQALSNQNGNHTNHDGLQISRSGPPTTICVEEKMRVNNANSFSTNHKNENEANAQGVVHPPLSYPKRTPSMILMPPPPPRRFSHSLPPSWSKSSNNGRHNHHIHNSDVSIPMLWTQSSSSSSSLGDRKLSSSSALEDNSLVVPPPTTCHINNVRQRSVSCDERFGSNTVKSNSSTPMTAVTTTLTTSTGGSNNDIDDDCIDGNGCGDDNHYFNRNSFQVSKHMMSYSYDDDDDDDTTTRASSSVLVPSSSSLRPRSASCSHLSTLGGCNTDSSRKILGTTMCSIHYECGTIAED